MEVHAGPRKNHFTVRVVPVLLEKCVKVCDVTMHNKGIMKISISSHLDTFTIESVVNTNELLSDLTPNAHIGLENADMMQGPFEIHSTYIAIGTLTVAICIVAVVVSGLKFIFYVGMCVCVHTQKGPCNAY